MAHPELIAHRGASREARENTLPAFRRAVERGADGIELDVHATRDGVVVVHHDATLGPAVTDPMQAGRPLLGMTATEVAAIRFADGSGIPTLVEVLAAVPSRVTLYVELKGREVERHVAPLLAPHAARVAVHGFDHRMPHALLGALPTVPRGILQGSYLVDVVGAMAAAGARDLWQHWEQVDPELVDAVHGAGGRVIAWTVNDPDAMRTLAAWGVDGLCTDDVRIAQAALGLGTENR